MEKYYTPEIEEFHIGFEYEEFCSYPIDSNGEWMSDPQWVKKIVKDYGQAINNWDKHHSKDFIYIPITGRYYNDGTPKENFNLENIFRVKYLDKEDIESLGFKLFSIQEDRGSIWCQFKHIFDNLTQIHCQLGLQFINKNTGVKINISTRYEGHLSIMIKNKSELKKLLKQLCITK